MMFLMAFLVGSQAGSIMGAHDYNAEPVSFERTLGTKILNVYRYNSNSISHNDLAVFLDVNAIGSLDDLTCIVKSFKRSLNQDLLLVKMENKSPLLYWAGFGAGSIAFANGIAGLGQQHAALHLHNLNNEDLKNDFDVNVKKHSVDPSNHSMPVAPVCESYIKKNMILYCSLVAAGVIAIPAAVCVLYAHYKYEQHQKNNIAALDAILEEIDAMQEAEEQSKRDMQDVIDVPEVKPTHGVITAQENMGFMVSA